MHHVTSHGAPKITMDAKRDYQERLPCKAQGDGNPNVMGVQMPEASYRRQTIPLEDVGRSGNIDMGTSMTENATKNPDQFQTKSLIVGCKMLQKL